MATRKITTRFAIEGEAQYRQEVAQINSQMKVLDSSLKLVSSQYKENANSLEALTAKSKALESVQAAQADKVKTLSEAYNNAQSSVKKYEDAKEALTEQINKTEQALEQLKTTQGDTTEEEKRLTEETSRLKSELEQNEEYLRAAGRGVNDWETKLNTAQAQLNDTNREIQKNDQYLEEAKTSADGCATSIDKFGNQVKSSNEQLSELSSLLASAGVIAGLKKLADGLVECVKSSIEFESAMTGVEKTTDLTSAELDDMAAAIRNLSTEIPATTTELAGIAENAGQLGIQKESILGFTRVMADLGVATNLAGEEAAQTFAKFANITGMARGDFDRLGSAVVALGNNLATTEADIASMALRLAAAGSQAGLSESEILGLAGALSSVGMEAQAGGTALSKAMNMLTVAVETGNESLTEFASVANMSASQFAKAFEEDAAQAIVAFINGLGDVESHGKSTVVLLEELGLTEIRLRDSLTRLANSGDLLADSIALGNSAWEENAALTKEAELRYGTTESKLAMLGNSFDNVQKTIGDQFNPALNGALDIGNDFLGWLDEFIQDNEWAVPIVTSFAVALGVLAVSITAYTVVVPMAQKVTEAFTAALSANPIFLVIAAIAGLITVIATFNDSVYSGTEAQRQARIEAQNYIDTADKLIETKRREKEAYEEAAAAMDTNAAVAKDLINEMDDLSKNENKSATDKAKLRLAIERLNEIYPELNVKISENGQAVEGGTGAIHEQIDALSALSEQQEAQERLNQLAADQKIYAAEIENTANEIANLKNTGADTFEVLNGMSDGTVILGEAAIATTAEIKELEEKLLHWEEAAAAAKEEEDALTASLVASIAETEYGSDVTGEYGEAQQRLQEVLQRSITRMDELELAYTETYKTAKETINGQIGLYDTFEHKATMTTDAMKEAWRSQAENVQKYQENLAFASEYLNDDIARAWSDGTTESAGYVQGFSEELRAMIDEHGKESEAVQKFVDDFNAAYADTADAKDSVAEVMADIEISYTKTMKSMQKTLNKTIEQMDKSELAAIAGNNTIAGLLKAYDDGMEAIYQKGAQAGKAFTDGYDSQQGIQSPAKTMEESGGYSVEGLEIAFEKGIAEIKRLGEKTGEAYMSGYDKDIEVRMARMPEMAVPVVSSSRTVTNTAPITIYAQSIGAAELDMITRHIDRHFGGATTVTLVRQ